MMRLNHHPSRWRPSVAVTSAAIIWLLFIAALVTQHVAADSAPAHSDVTQTDPSSPLSSSSSSSTPFIPTHQFQDVPPDTPLPPGLHVRVNLATGRRQAKLAEDDDGSVDVSRGTQDDDAHLAVVPQSQQSDEQVDQASSQSADAESASTQTVPVMHTLLIPSTDDDSFSSSPPSTPEQYEAFLAARAARLHLLRSHFFMKEDVEQMRRLLEVCIAPESSVEHVLQAMEVLEEAYVHQVDNAMDFAKIGGIDVMLTFLAQDEREIEATTSASTQHHHASPSTAGQSSQQNATDSTTLPPAPIDLQSYRLHQLQSSAALVIGSSCQNNKFVQDAARSMGAIDTLVKLMKRGVEERMEGLSKGSTGEARSLSSASSASTSSQTSSSSDYVTAFQRLSSRLKVQARTLYALSALLRNNADNQREFFERHGMDVLRQAMEMDTRTEMEMEMEMGAAGGDREYRSLRCRHDEQPQPSASDVTSTTSSSPLSCLTSSEYKQIVRLHDTCFLKRLQLLQDLAVDHTINSQPSPSPSSVSSSSSSPSAHSNEAAPLSDSTPVSFAPAFDILGKPEWCWTLLRAAAINDQTLRGSAAPSMEDDVAWPKLRSTTLNNARQQALETLKALVGHDGGMCIDALRRGPVKSSHLNADAILQRIIAQESQWAREEAAEAAAAGQDEVDNFHADMRDAAISIRQRLKGEPLGQRVEVA